MIAIESFKELIAKVEEDLVFEEVGYKQLYKVVSNIKRSKAMGDNKLCNMFLKELPQYSLLALMHLFNSILRTGRFPKEFKMSRIIPLRKKDKNPANLNSFCPINN